MILTLVGAVLFLSPFVFSSSVNSSEFTEKDCCRDVQVQPTCKALIRVFKWDLKEQRCVAAIYGGCNPTKNNFKTEAECQKHAAPVCKKIHPHSTFEVGDCEKDVEQGPVHCEAYIPVYKWDQCVQKCVKAIYGGCHPSPNNFKTEEECLKYAAPVCTKKLSQTSFQLEDCKKDVEHGPIHCLALIPVYKWDELTQKCVKAIYGGCNATPNNFKTEDECLKYAAPVCSKKLSQTGFQLEDCKKDVEHGPIHCLALIPVYKWDELTQTCVKAIYGGCNATPNNFKTEIECLKCAAPICRKKVSQTNFQFEDCKKDVQYGPIHCKAYMPVYKWDQRTQKCVKAIYGGCNATPNNFKTKVECQKYAEPICRKRCETKKL